MADAEQSTASLTEMFIKQVDAGAFVTRVFEGVIDLSGRTFEKTMILASLHFKHAFIADSATFSGLAFEGCRFDGGLAIRHSRIRGDLTLRKCRFPAAGRGQDGAKPASLDLRGSTVAGSLKLSGGAIAGDCLLDRIVVRGNLRIREDASVTGATSFAGARIDSRLDLSGCRLGEIVFNGSTLGALWIGSREPVSCTGLYATDTQVRTFARLTRFTAGTKGAPARRRSKRLHLEEVGTIAFRGCSFGSLFSTWVVKRYGEEEDGWQDDNCVVAEKAFLFSDCKVKGELTLSRLRIGRAEPGRAVDAQGKPAQVSVAPGAEKPWGHARLDRTEVEGAFLILSPISVAHRFEMSSAARQKARQAIMPDPMNPKFRAHMRSLSMRDFKAAYIDLSGLSLHDCGRDDSDWPLDGCVVGDRLEVKSSITTYAWSTDAEQAGDAALTPGGGQAAGAPQTGKVRAYTEISGALRLRGASIGELRLAAESFGTAEGCKAHTDGVVLELASIGELRVPPRAPPRTGKSDKEPAWKRWFKRSPKQPQTPAPTPAPEPEPPGHHNDFPVPLDLFGMTIRHWNFEEDVNAEGTADVEHYLDFLDNDEKLHREVYRSVAKSLRDVGRDDDAEKVLYTEEYRARWERHRLDTTRREAARPSSAGASEPAAADRKPADWPPYRDAGRRPTPWLRRLRDRLPEWLRNRHPFELMDRWLLQYRRNPIRLLYMILGLFAFSAVFVGGHAANFELSDQARLIMEHKGAQKDNFAAGIDWKFDGSNVGPRDAQWKLGDALWMTARYHVPIVPMAFRDEYAASNDNPLTVGLGWKWRLGFTAAEDWFVLMALLNWIMWPLLLTFALRRALRAE